MRVHIDNRLCSILEEGNYATLAYPKGLGLTVGKVINFNGRNWSVLKIGPSDVLKTIMLAKLELV